MRRRFAAHCAYAGEQDSEQPAKKRDRQREVCLSAVAICGHKSHTYTHAVADCPNKNSKTNVIDERQEKCPFTTGSGLMPRESTISNYRHFGTFENGFLFLTARGRFWGLVTESPWRLKYTYLHIHLIIFSVPGESAASRTWLRAVRLVCLAS